MHIRIGTRGSRLALAQTKEVADTLRHAYPEDTFEIITIKTKGDKNVHQPLHMIGDKGIFVKEIEEQILDGRIDMGVHSMKDMPSHIPSGLVFAKIWKREDPRDVLIAKQGGLLFDLPPHAVIATGSLRRSLQIKALRPDLQIIGIRGNVDTRLQKMRDGNIDGLIMAAAGMHRLGLHDPISEYFSVDTLIPACAQGALALECRKSDHWLKEKLDALQYEPDAVCVEAERMFLACIGGGCHIPMGAYCMCTSAGYRMIGMLGKEGSSHICRKEMNGNDPLLLAKQLAQTLMQEVRHG